ncbi:hypothetical protein [Lichenifustis flavocetrariae]|uniref:Uncharacterized protein n=1 Tax=Lichenifustis flavocetrariae TaxID=2949735 RepID=A0AA41YT77_9HYPH|nr:hypothetical protein [Lichenifustis flavocetrariae]MCW6506885.1 hypothetical protein [Lichenifustis flavocetrariae]
MSNQDPDFISGRMDDAEKAYADRVHQDRSKAIEFSKDYGTATIRSLFLLNGGAAVAVLSLIGALIARTTDASALLAAKLVNGVSFALCSFCVGLVFAVVPMALGYINFMLIAHTVPTPLELFAAYLRNFEHSRSTVQANKWAIRTMWMAIVAAFVSAALFSLGVFLVYRAFDKATSG